MECENGHEMPFNPDHPAGFDCIFCEKPQQLGAVDLLREPSLSFVHEVREGQISLADAVNQDIRYGRASCYEAGTGVGKSYAYLLPAILSGKRVIVSTAKIALQNQLLQKDLPHIKQELTRLRHPRKDFSFFAVYGKSNYACHLAYRKEKLDNAREWKTFLNFSSSTKYQRFDEWDSQKGYVDRTLNASSCVGPNCAYYRTCGYQKARREAAEADVVVTNNWVLGYHLRLKHEQNYVQLLGDYEHVIVDEAHKVEEGIRAAFTNETKVDTLVKLRKQLDKLSQMTMENLEVPEINTLEPFWEHAFRDLMNCKRNQDNSIPTITQGRIQNICAQLDVIRDVVMDMGFMQRVFPHAETALKVHRHLDEKYVRSAINTASTTTGRVPNPAPASQTPAFALSEESQARYLDLDKFLRHVKDAQETFEHVLEASPYRTWTIEERFEGRPIPVLKDIPVTVGHYLPKKQITYLSATLALGNSFDTFASRVGLSQVPYEKEIFPSPFDIQRQAFLYIPNPGSQAGRIPVPENKQGEARTAYLDAVATHVLELLLASEGDAFVLFTAKSELSYCHEFLKNAMYPFPVFAQGDFTPAEALQRFRATDKSTILGVKSFWEGIDIQGDKLFLVIVAKLPFPNTSDPIYQARCNLVNQNSPGVSEQVVRVPDMLFDLRQGVGRLIRSKTDRGVIAILDTRSHLKYKRAVQTALGLRPHTDLEKMCRAIRTRHNKRAAE